MQKQGKTFYNRLDCTPLPEDFPLGPNELN